MLVCSTESPVGNISTQYQIVIMLGPQIPEQTICIYSVRLAPEVGATRSAVHLDDSKLVLT